MMMRCKHGNEKGKENEKKECWVAYRGKAIVRRIGVREKENQLDTARKRFRNETLLQEVTKRRMV